MQKSERLSYFQFSGRSALGQVEAEVKGVEELQEVKDQKRKCRRRTTPGGGIEKTILAWG
jgi:hypothetical protein